MYISREQYIDNDIYEPMEDNIIPTTDTGDICVLVEEDENNNDVIDGHVILNQCGSLLSRNDNHIRSYRTQKHFLQRIASIVNNETIPLLYPEAMLFPSIFWYLSKDSGSYLGAIPSCLLGSDLSLHGIASIKSHIDTRLTTQFSTSSTNPSYISFQFDILSNLLLNVVDSRLIIARGLTCTDGNVGIKLRSSNETSLHDSIDSKQIVKNLCASQKYLPMHFFLTFTVNQMEHFGIKNIKSWIDSDYKWINRFAHKLRNKEFSEQEKIKLKKSMNQAAAPILLRNWMETRIIFLNYIYTSPKSPYHPVQAIFSRDEYQKDKGNLPHIHLILSVMFSDLNEQQRERIDNLIRASVCSIRTGSEIQELIDEGIIKNWENMEDIKDLAKKILSHKCNERCLRRISDGNGPENFKCRKLNNYLVSPDHTKNSFISIETKQTKECMDQLIKIGMADPIILNKYGIPSDFKARHSYFHPKRHIPPTNPNEDYNISPVEGYTFSICKSMQNIQSLTHTNGLNRYVCKYVGKLDEQNQIIVNSHPYDNGKLISNYTFLHNTKITSSKLNEEKVLKKRRDKYHPKGRAISLMEMLQIMLSYPQVKTDMTFEVIATVPLEQRRGVEVNAQLSPNRASSLDIENDERPDGIDTAIPIHKARKEKNLCHWRQLRTNELITLEGALSSGVSIDKITQFSLRPPELRLLVTELGNYYRWFYISKKKISFEQIDSMLKSDLKKTIWIDGFQKQVKIRIKAIPEILKSIESKEKNKFFQNLHSIDGYDMIMWFKEIYRLQNVKFEQMNSYERTTLAFISTNLLHRDSERHLPIPVFSFIKPTMGHRFILHILLSMGHYETELDLLLHRNLKNALRYAKLIGPSDNKSDLEYYSNQLQKKFIEEQLVYFPNSSKMISNWIIIAGELFDSVIINDEIPITEMPPVLQTQLECVQEEKIYVELDKIKKAIIDSSYQELQHVGHYFG
ncbi:MAG: hypothetical protein ACPGDB_01450, partial [Fusobacterium sp.]